MNKETRLKNVSEETQKRRRRRQPDFVVYWRDYENQCLYTRPFYEENSRLVTPEELESAVRTFRNVIIVAYEPAPLPGQPGYKPPEG